jgi:hypothetical protein
LATKKTVKRPTSKGKPAGRPKDLAVKRATAIKGGLARRSDPCDGDPVLR